MTPMTLIDRIHKYLCILLITEWTEFSFLLWIKIFWVCNLPSALYLRSWKPLSRQGFWLGETTVHVKSVLLLPNVKWIGKIWGFLTVYSSMWHTKCANWKLRMLFCFIFLEADDTFLKKYTSIKTKHISWLYSWFSN